MKDELKRHIHEALIQGVLTFITVYVALMLLGY